MDRLITVGQLARAYGVSLTDYQRDAAGLGIVNGAGGMLTLMDHRPDLRWALSLEGISEENEQIGAFLEAVGCLGVPVCGWLIFMGLTSTAAVRSLLARLGGCFEYAGNASFPGKRVTLQDLLRGHGTQKLRSGPAADRVVPTAEAAQRLKVTQMTVRRWLASGRLTGQRLGCILVVEESAVAELERARRSGRP